MGSLFNTSPAVRKLRKAFRMLRREGIQAQMEYVCCMSCGAPDAPFFCPLVYVLKEDEQVFGTTGVLPVHFRNPDNGDHRGTRALGDQVRIALEMSGLRVDWSGDPAHPVMILA